jgi:hypothetical protein
MRIEKITIVNRKKNNRKSQYVFNHLGIGTIQFKCELCPKFYPLQSALTKHMRRTHRGNILLHLPEEGKKIIKKLHFFQSSKLCALYAESIFLRTIIGSISNFTSKVKWDFFFF